MKSFNELYFELSASLKSVVTDYFKKKGITVEGQIENLSKENLEGFITAYNENIDSQKSKKAEEVVGNGTSTERVLYCGQVGLSYVAHTGQEAISPDRVDQLCFLLLSIREMQKSGLTMKEQKEKADQVLETLDALLNTASTNILMPFNHEGKLSGFETASHSSSRVVANVASYVPTMFGGKTMQEKCQSQMTKLVNRKVCPDSDIGSKKEEISEAYTRALEGQVFTPTAEQKVGAVKTHMSALVGSDCVEDMNKLAQLATCLGAYFGDAQKEEVKLDEAYRLVPGTQASDLTTSSSTSFNMSK